MNLETDIFKCILAIKHNSPVFWHNSWQYLNIGEAFTNTAIQIFRINKDDFIWRIDKSELQIFPFLRQLFKSDSIWLEIILPASLIHRSELEWLYNVLSAQVVYYELKLYCYIKLLFPLYLYNRWWNNPITDKVL